VKDCEAFGKRIELVLRKRRYICTSCGKRFTEGCNNKIKVLKRNAYGYRRFDRFRNRILHIFSHQNAA
jgi:transposase